MTRDASTLSQPALGAGFRPGAFRCAINFILAMVFITASPARAEQCPSEGLSEFCCRQADPQDAMDLSNGGYGWHPGPSDTAGLCQGLASRNVSGPLIWPQDLRETETLTTMPDSLVVGYRALPGSPNRFVFSGTALTSGNNYFIAGSFETGNDVVWDTRPFSGTGQKLSRFGFVAVGTYKRRTVYTPLVFREVGAPLADRARGQFVLRSASLIKSAAITIEQLDPDTLEPMGGKPWPLKHTQPGARMLHAKLSPKLPEAFLVSVAICTADTSNCQANEGGPQPRKFRIVWPKP